MGWSSTQDLKADQYGQKYDKSLIHKRAYYHFDNDDQMRAEWVIGSKTFNLGITVSRAYVSDDTMTFVFAIPPFALYTGFTSKWLESKRWWKKLVREDENDIRTMKTVTAPGIMTYHKHAEERAFGFRIFDWTIWGEFYANAHDSKSTDPKWMRWNFDVLVYLFGDYDCNYETLEERDVKIPMPEKEYDAHVKMEKLIRQRKKWRWKIPPFYQEIIRADIDMVEPIPHPGKGTCSYNCGEDAIQSLSCPVKSVDEAICEMIKSVTLCRLRYPL